MDITITPRDTIDAMRLMRREKLAEPGDTNEEKQALQGIIAIYLSSRRAGLTDLEFAEWYNTADLSEIDDEEGGADPTG
jgi:hypothetical protein